MLDSSGAEVKVVCELPEWVLGTELQSLTEQASTFS